MSESNESSKTDLVHGMRVAVEGCGHGTLDAIYASIHKSCEVKGWDGVDLVIIGGDFQAVRDKRDLNVTAMPVKYREMADFHQYYWGTKTAPFLTIFIGGNHEASNHLFELYYGGWVAPNIYYLGAANVIQVGPLKIAGMSGIWKGYDYRKPHYERLPYSSDDMYSIYHVRELDVRKLLSYRSQVDIGLSHDWPKGIEWLGDHRQLFAKKTFLREDAQSGKLGNVAAQQVMDRLRPPYWFSAHLHVKYAATKSHSESNQLQNFHRSEAPLTSISNVRAANMLHSPDKQQISAWNDFSTHVQEQEAQETAKMLVDEKERRDAAERLGKPMVANYVFNETYKKVKLGENFDRNITTVTYSEDGQSQPSERSPISQLDGCCISLPLKRRHEQSPPANDHEQSNTEYSRIGDVQADESTISPIDQTTRLNPDAIDIDMSDDEDETSNLTSAPSGSTGKNGIHTSDEENDISKQPATEIIDSQYQSMVGPKAAPNNEVISNDVAGTSSENDSKTPTTNDVPEHVRAQLAALSSKFEDSPISAPLPHPESITNTQTKFLALSKAENHQDFLQLLELQPYHSTEESIERPVKLQYDPEWLAILRVFASELAVGGSHAAQIPKHRGDTFYRDRILEEEKWIEDHVVKSGRLMVPENFNKSIYDYDANPVDDNDGMPRETTNPQTVTFCDLIGIDNAFDFSEENRNARIAAGPVESRKVGHSNRGSRGGRGGRSFGRGGRVGRGYRGRSRGQGRGW